MEMAELCGACYCTVDSDVDVLSETQGCKMKIPVQGMPNWENRTLFHGDNLGFLRAMNSNSVHLIATDPPFNKGRDFHATPDSLSDGASFHDRWSWDKDVHQEWVDQITDDWPHVMNVIQGSRNSYGDDMGAFLCYMAVRLLAMRRILRDDGSIYLHCDPTASHYLKELMDAVFGRKNFRNEIVWLYEGRELRKTSYNSKHDVILFYSKGKKMTFNWEAIGTPLKESSRKALSRLVDENGRAYLLRYKKGGGFAPDALEGSPKVYRQYVPNAVPPRDWIHIDMARKSERKGYPTQKPLALYERIILASSNEKDIVLDPFAGCATTCVAAERLGRQWVGIDIWDKAHEVVIERLEEEGLLGGYTLGEINYTTELPERTDNGETSAPFLKTKKRVDEPKGERMSRSAMVEYLLEQHGCRCQGCGREFDDARYLELDHNTPRSDGGLNHISNRILLCGPCNKAKSHTLTLSGLRKLNKKKGWMAGRLI